MEIKTKYDKGDRVRVPVQSMMPSIRIVVPLTPGSSQVTQSRIDQFMPYTLREGKVEKVLVRTILDILSIDYVVKFKYKEKCGNTIYKVDITITISEDMIA
jgi:hypothetical protein